MWEDEVLQRLRDRDKIEKKDLEYFVAFDLLRRKLRDAETKIQRIDAEELKELVGGTDFNNNASTSGGNTSGGGINHSKNTKSNEQIGAEDEQMVRMILISNQLGFENKRLTEEVANLKSIEAKLSVKLEVNNAKLEAMKQEIVQKNKAIELINDEVLSSQIQNNVLLKLIADLRQENDMLVERWITKAKEHADRLNEVTEMLQRERLGKDTKY